MTISLWLDTQSDKPVEEFDAVVIGAGITGSATAWWLSRRKDLKVAVLDANAAGAGASGRSAGTILRSNLGYYSQLVKTYGREKARCLFRFVEESQAHLADFMQKQGNRFSYEKCGSYMLAASIEELQVLAESAQLMQEDGFAVEYLKSDPIDRGFYGALYSAADIGVDPYLLVKALLEASGAALFENEQVFQIEWANNQPLLHTPKRLLAASRVLLCTNAYLPWLYSDFASLLKAVRGQILVTRPLKDRVLDRLCLANFGYDYFRQLADGRLLLGGCREPFLDEEYGYADNVTRSVQGALQNYLKTRFPEAAGARIDYRWSGTMCFSSDGLPLIGELNDKPGVVYAAGCNGQGLTWGLALSRLLVEFAFDGASPAMFDSRRLPSLMNPSR
jgi:gamma-glutamylputrescine oxidase